MKKVILLMFMACLFMGCKNEAGSNSSGTEDVDITAPVERTILEIRNEIDARVSLDGYYIANESGIYNESNIYDFMFEDVSVAKQASSHHYMIELQPYQTKEVVIKDLKQGEIILAGTYYPGFDGGGSFDSGKIRFYKNKKTIVKIKTTDLGNGSFYTYFE